MTQRQPAAASAARVEAPTVLGEQQARRARSRGVATSALPATICNGSEQPAVSQYLVKAVGVLAARADERAVDVKGHERWRGHGCTAQTGAPPAARRPSSRGARAIEGWALPVRDGCGCVGAPRSSRCARAHRVYVNKLLAGGGGQWSTGAADILAHTHRRQGAVALAREGVPRAMTLSSHRMAAAAALLSALLAALCSCSAAARALAQVRAGARHAASAPPQRASAYAEGCRKTDARPCQHCMSHAARCAIAGCTRALFSSLAVPTCVL